MMHSITSPAKLITKVDSLSVSESDASSVLPLDTTEILSPFPAVRQDESGSSMMSPITATKLLVASIAYMEEPVQYQQDTPESHTEKPNLRVVMSPEDPFQGLKSPEDPSPFANLREQSYFSDLRQNAAGTCSSSSSHESAKQAPVPPMTPAVKEEHQAPKSASEAPIPSPVPYFPKLPEKQQQSQPQTIISTPSFTSPIKVTKKRPAEKQEQARASFLSPINTTTVTKGRYHQPAKVDTRTVLFLSPITSCHLDTTKASNVNCYAVDQSFGSSQEQGWSSDNDKSSSTNREHHHQPSLIELVATEEDDDDCFIDVELGHQDMERPIPPLMTTPTDPVFEVGEVDHKSNHTVSLCLLGCVLLLVGVLAAGGISMLVLGSQESGADIKYVDPSSPGLQEEDLDLLPLRNVTDDDHFGWDCDDSAYQEYFLRKVIRRVTDRSALRTPGTPQYQAFEWLVHTDAPARCPSYFWEEDHVSLIQRYILAVFYFSTHGKGWNRCSAPDYFASHRNVAEANSRCEPLQSYKQKHIRRSHHDVQGGVVDIVFAFSSNSSDVALAWLTSAPECHWGGVSCDDFGNIIELDIENNNLEGSVPAELEHLQSLQALRLKIGKLSGEIPSVLGNLPLLEDLSLEFNVLQGLIPNTLYQLNNLTSLDLSNNMLSGPIAPKVGDLHKLQQLRLDNNFLTGSLPKTLGNIPQLTSLSTQFNDLSGTVPDGLCLGHMDALTMDCRGGDIIDVDGTTLAPFVECPCCTFCF